MISQKPYTKEYFSFIEDVDHYINKIYGFLKSNIHDPISKNCSEKFQNYGKKFLRYKTNNQKSWYIFFYQRDHRILVNHILNNHFQDFPELL